MKTDLQPNIFTHFKCDDCGKDLLGSELVPINNLEKRLDIGGEVPGGECPDCGSLAYIVGRPKN